MLYIIIIKEIKKSFSFVMSKQLRFNRVNSFPTANYCTDFTRNNSSYYSSIKRATTSATTSNFIFIYYFTASGIILNFANWNFIFYYLSYITWCVYPRRFSREKTQIIILNPRIKFTNKQLTRSAFMIYY
jgi:hypothetical protein